MGYFLYAIFCFAGGMGASPLTALIRGQFVRGSHERRRPFLLIILTQLKLFVSKRWASKNCWGQFFRCVIRADFFESTLWAEKAVNFLNREGQKRGATRGPRQERFSFVRCEAMSKVQKRYSLPKSNRNSR